MSLLALELGGGDFLYRESLGRYNLVRSNRMYCIKVKLFFDQQRPSETIL